eukprot:9280571-Heterocapsa_arctica.AAC.1
MQGLWKEGSYEGLGEGSSCSNEGGPAVGLVAEQGQLQGGVLAESSGQGQEDHPRAREGRWKGEAGEGAGGSCREPSLQE